MAEIRICKTCGKEKPLTYEYFRRNKDWFRWDCRECERERDIEYGINNPEKAREKVRKYNKNNREKRREYVRKYKKNNFEKTREYTKNHREENRNYRIKNADKLKKYLANYRKENPDYYKNWYQENKEEANKKNNEKRRENADAIREGCRRYRKNNREKINKKYNNYIKERKKYDINFKLRLNLRTRIYHAIKSNNAKKYGKSLQLVGCTIKELKQHIENQFIKNMNWNNYGEWQIDHIRPCASFDLTDPEQQKTCFNYMNLQPLWAEENYKKGATWPLPAAVSA